MKWLVIILLCGCTTTKTYYLDSSASQGNLVKREWLINGYYYDSSLNTNVNAKKTLTIELIVTDNKGRKDTAQQTIK